MSRYFKLYWDDEQFPAYGTTGDLEHGAWVCPDCGEASKTRRIQHDEHCPRMKRRRKVGG